jgi:hypothetical protein
MGDKFTPEARAELLAMYTGMAMQGLLMGDAALSDEYIANAAVRQAAATVDALERFHAGQPQ